MRSNIKIVPSSDTDFAANRQVLRSAGFLPVVEIDSRERNQAAIKFADGGVEDFLKRVQETHGDNIHAQTYRLAVEMAKVQFGVKEAKEKKA